MGSRLSLSFDRGFPRDIRTEVSALIRKHAPRLMPHVREIYVHLEALDSDAEIAVRPQYHNAHLAIDRDWRENTAAQKEQLIAHELAHAVLQDFWLFFGSVIDTYVPEGPKDHVAETARFFLEQATDRVAWAVVE